MNRLRRDALSFAGIMLVPLAGKLLILLGQVSHPQARGSLLQWRQIGLLGILGLGAVLLAPRAGFASMWAEGVGHIRRFGRPVALGAVFAAVEIITSLLLGYPDFHVGFPYSIPLYTAAGTLYEIKYHLLPLVGLVWLISNVVLKKKRPETVFWIVAVLLSLREPLAQVQMMMRMGLISGTFWTVEMFIQIYTANLVPLWLFRRGGFFAMWIFRITVYILWHILWPPLYFGL